MEIRDYLRAIRRILWLVIALPIVAALITGFLIERQPSAYQANASVVVPAISGNGTSQSAASQYVSTFKDVLVSQPVVTEVAQKFGKYGITVSELTSGLSASTVTASSNIIHIVLVGRHGQPLEGAVREATVDTMNAIATPKLTEAQSEVANAQTLLQTAQAAITSWVATTGNPSPQQQYNSVQAALNTQLLQLTQAKINGDTAREAALNANIATLRQTLQTDGAQVQQYQILNDAQLAAIAANDHAKIDLVNAQALIAADANPNTVNTVNVGRLSKLSDVIKFAGIGFALALIMMLGLILIIELMRSGRRPQDVTDPEQGAFAWPAPAAQPRSTEPAASMGSEPSVVSRDPWRASPGPGAMAAAGNGNGHTNGNGHSNGNGNGHAAVRPDEPEQQEAARRLLRRR